MAPIDVQSATAENGDDATLCAVDYDEMCHLGFAVFRGYVRIDMYSRKNVLASPEDWTLSFGLKAGTVSTGCKLDAGDYVIVLNTGSSKERCQFRLRVFSESSAVQLVPLDGKQ